MEVADKSMTPETKQWGEKCLGIGGIQQIF